MRQLNLLWSLYGLACIIASGLGKIFVEYCLLIYCYSIYFLSTWRPVLLVSCLSFSTFIPVQKYELTKGCCGYGLRILKVFWLMVKIYRKLYKIVYALNKAIWKTEVLIAVWSHFFILLFKGLPLFIVHHPGPSLWNRRSCSFQQCSCCPYHWSFKGQLPNHMYVLTWQICHLPSLSLSPPLTGLFSWDRGNCCIACSKISALSFLVTVCQAEY